MIPLLVPKPSKHLQCTVVRIYYPVVFYVLSRSAMLFVVTCFTDDIPKKKKKKKKKLTDEETVGKIHVFTTSSC